MVTLGIFAILLIFWLCMKRKGKRGDTFLMFCLLYGASQTVFDSTRYDSLYLRSNGFVSMVQIAGAVALAFAVVCFSVRLVKARGWRFWYLLPWLTIAGLLGGAGYMEYHVQRHGDQALFAYTIMSGCLIAVILLGIAIYTLAVVGENRKKKIAPTVQEAEETDEAEEIIFSEPESAEPAPQIAAQPELAEDLESQLKEAMEGI